MPPALKLALSPTEVSSLTNRVTVSQHASDCAFQWIRRERAIGAPQYRMRNLLMLDRQIEANREGLVHAGNDGWAICRDLRETGEPGEIFASALVAFSSISPDRMREVGNLALTTPTGQRALISALAWLPFEPLAPVLRRMAKSADSRWRRVSLRVFSLHRNDPFDALPGGLADDDPEVVAAAVRGLGETGRRDALGALQALLARADRVADAARVSIATSMAMLGSHDALDMLEEAVDASSADIIPSLDILLRAVTPTKGRRLLSRLGKAGGDGRTMVAATGILGDPSAVPWLISKMRDPALARIAGESFSFITGADIEYLDLDMDAVRSLDFKPPGFDHDSPEEVHPDDDRLPLPDADKVEQWWATRGAGLSTGTRYLCGHAISRPSLLTTLRSGYQRQRSAAALELAVLSPDTPLFDTRRRADLQLRALDLCS